MCVKSKVVKRNGIESRNTSSTWYSLNVFPFLCVIYCCSIVVFVKALLKPKKSIYLTSVCTVCVCTWHHPWLPLLREGALGLLMRGEALQSHYCHKVGHLSHVSLHAQSRWVTAVIGIRDYSTLWWLSLLRHRISTFPPAVCWVSANAKVKKDPSASPLPVRSTST